MSPVMFWFSLYNNLRLPTVGYANESAEDLFEFDDVPPPNKYALDSVPISINFLEKIGLILKPCLI